MDDLTQLREAVMRRTLKPACDEQRVVSTDELERRLPHDIALKPSLTRELIDRSIREIGVERTERVLRGTGLTPDQIQRLASISHVCIHANGWHEEMLPPVNSGVVL